MPATDFHIAIVGLGPVGLLAAHALSQKGWRIIAIEQHKERLPYPRAIALDSEIIRIFQSLGLEQELLAQMQASNGLQFINSQEEPLLHIRIQSANGYHESWMFYQPELEALLEGKLQQYQNLTIFKEYQLQQLRQKESNVELTISNTLSQKEKVVTAQYLIGADGANSTVRQLLGITQKTWHYSGYNLKIDARLLPSYPTESIPPAVVQKHCSSHFPWVRMQGRGRHARWEFPIKKPAQNTDIEQLAQQLLQQAKVPTESLELLHTSLYQYHSSITSNWHQGRVFLAGDAAHLTPPYIGQGLCAGFRDIANLSWKLDQALKAPQKKHTLLLESYQREREPHFLFALKIAIAVGFLFKTPLHHIIRPLRHLPLLKKLSQNLHVSPPKIGKGHWGKGRGKRKLFPQCLLTLNNGKQVQSDIFLGENWVILGLKPIPRELIEHCQQRGLQVRHLSPSLNPSLHLTQWMKKNHATYAIIRPDKYVYSTGDDVGKLLRDIPY